MPNFPRPRVFVLAHALNNLDQPDFLMRSAVQSLESPPLRVAHRERARERGAGFDDPDLLGDSRELAFNALPNRHVDAV